MPVTKSAQKAIKKERKRRKNNIGYKKRIKELKKQLFNKKENQQEQQEMLSKYYKAVDKAVKTGVIKKNTAKRKKSRIARTIKQKAGK